MARKYSKKAGKKVERAMHERKSGTLRSGRSGKKVRSRKQAIAIGLSEARKAGAKVPRKKSARKKIGTRPLAARVARPLLKIPAGVTEPAGASRSRHRQAPDSRPAPVSPSTSAHRTERAIWHRCYQRSNGHRALCSWVARR
jgi:hypothetical protein